jgi:uncharacterized cupin superfamily protein
MLMVEDMYLLFYSLAGAAAAFVAALLARLTRVKDGYLNYDAKTGKRETKPLAFYSVPAGWVQSGAPIFRSTTFGVSHDRSTSTGLWECLGPATFDWHYGNDESIYILEGHAHVEYLGCNLALSAGDCTHFAAGTVARWHVPERVKKSYMLYNPGRLIRKMRMVTGALGWQKRAARNSASV